MKDHSDLMRHNRAQQHGNAVHLEREAQAAALVRARPSLWALSAWQCGADGRRAGALCVRHLCLQAQGCPYDCLLPGAPQTPRSHSAALPLRRA